MAQGTLKPPRGGARRGRGALFGNEQCAGSGSSSLLCTMTHAPHSPKQNQLIAALRFRAYEHVLSNLELVPLPIAQIDMIHPACVAHILRREGAQRIALRVRAVQLVVMIGQQRLPVHGARHHSPQFVIRVSQRRRASIRHDKLHHNQTR